MSIKTFIITYTTLVVKSAVQEILSNRSNPPNLTQNVPFCTRNLNLLFSEKHKRRFAPLILSFPKWHLRQATPLRSSSPGGTNVKTLTYPLSQLCRLLLYSQKYISKANYMCMISLADFVSLPAKVGQLLVLFSNSESIFV